MSTAPLPEMETLKSRLKATWEAGDFAEIAKGIEETADEFINRLNITRGMKVLDVACGSGNLAVRAAKKGADVTGLDLADNLVEAAKRRAEAEGLNIKVEQGDAEALPYADDSFDVVMTMFGAMFAPRPEIVASELVRVCKPGGRIAMANWTPDGMAGQMFKLSTKYLPPPNMPPPVLWGVEEIVRERFGDSLSDLQMTRRMAEMKFDLPPDEVVEHFKKFFGPTVMAFKALDPERREELTSDMKELWNAENLATDGSTYARGEFLEVIGTKR